jgi:threonine/homoserine/homoserine lactone efflux protein
VNAHLLALYLVTLGLAMVVPGPDMLFVLGTGMRGGPRAGLIATCGVATSEAIHVTLAAAGLSALFAAAPTAFAVVRIAGAAYLVLLGIRTIRGHSSALPDRVPAAAAGVSHRRAYVRGLVTNLVNPKMVTFTIAFLPQFVDRSLGHVPLQFTVLGAIFVTLEFLVDGTVGVLAGRIGRRLLARRRTRRGVDVATGGLFIGLGVRLAAER